MTDSADDRVRLLSEELFARATTDFLRRRFRLADEAGLELVGRLMRASLNGHGCLDLAGVPDPSAAIGALNSVPRLLHRIDDRDLATADAGKIVSPLVAWRWFVFTQRQFREELEVARQIVSRHQLQFPGSAPAFAHLDGLASELLPVTASDQIDGGVNDLQNRAATGILRSTLGVLTGGPGTGKTYTLVRCLALVVRGYLDLGQEPRIAVCAPTGKAATRAAEILASFSSDDAVRSIIGSDVVERVAKVVPTTVHHLLGGRTETRGERDSSLPQHLPVDVVVVDETSMMSTALMSSLLSALAPSTRILLVGDPAQLESVEIGAVLGELVSVAHRLDGAVHGLQHIFRTTATSQIPGLARAIRSGNDDGVIAQLTSGHQSTRWRTHDARRRPPADIVHEIVDSIRPAVEVARAAQATDDDRLRALRTINGTKVLCGPRQGLSGVAGWNAAIADALGLPVSDPPPPGVPILITVNTPRLGLVNGTLGLVVAVEVDGQRRERVAFEDNGAVRYLDRGQLPAHEVCFAMTVHKSQGSEYGGLLVVALPRVGSPLLTRELFYTGVTRGKNSVVVVADEDAVRSATNSPSRRTSAFGQMIDHLIGAGARQSAPATL